MSKRILWIEDEYYKFNYLSNGMKDKGIEVTPAIKEEEWNKWLRKKAGYFDIVILDIMLPKGIKFEDEKSEIWRKRGEKLLVEMKKKWPNIPVIIFTAKPALINEDRLKSLGADDYIEKPVLMREFEEIIYKYLGMEE